MFLQKSSLHEPTRLFCIKISQSWPFWLTFFFFLPVVLGKLLLWSADGKKMTFMRNPCANAFIKQPWSHHTQKWAAVGCQRRIRQVYINLVHLWTQKACCHHGFSSVKFISFIKRGLTKKNEKAEWPKCFIITGH